MPDVSSRPLLTLVVPTYNRASKLETLLAILEPQLAEFAQQIQFIVSDNGSPDNTPAIVAAAAARYSAAGISFEAIRHPQNLGPDANFLGCFQRARGHFFWICGDDDVIVPGALAEVMSHLRGANGEPAEIDLIWATSYGYREDYLAERQTDPFGRSFHTITDVHTLVTVVNMMFTFVSGMIINRDRLESIPHEDPSAFLNTFLIQISWTLPLLLHFRKAVVLWTRPLAVRQGHANGYSLGKVFGQQLNDLTRRLLPGRPDLSQPIINFALRRWLPSILLDIRVAGDPSLRFDEAPAQLRKAFGKNPRFWIFTWPVLVLPMPLARVWEKSETVFSKLVYMARVPGFWRKQT
jgi:abequosyltransferase